MARGRPRRIFYLDEPPLELYPHFGRYRLFSWSGAKLRCRLCGLTVRLEAQWRHYGVELRKVGGDVDRATEALKNRLLRNRKDHYRREAQRYHEVAKEQGVEVDHD